MSPEMVNGDLYSTETDVWSFGCFIYELGKGEPPFEECNNVEESILEAISNRGSLKIPGRDVKFNDLLSKCTQKDAGLRITIKEVLEHEYLAGAERMRDLWVQDYQRYQEFRAANNMNEYSAFHF